MKTTSTSALALACLLALPPFGGCSYTGDPVFTDPALLPGDAGECDKSRDTFCMPDLETRCDGECPPPGDPGCPENEAGACMSGGVVTTRIFGAGQELDFLPDSVISFGGVIDYDETTDTITGSFTIANIPIDPGGVFHVSCTFDSFSNWVRNSEIQVELDAVGTCDFLTLDGTVTTVESVNQFTISDIPPTIGADIFTATLLSPTGINVPTGAIDAGELVIVDFAFP